MTKKTRRQMGGLDEVAEEIRQDSEALDPELVRSATERVGTALFGAVSADSGSVLDCHGIRSRLPGHLNRSLSSDEQLLVREHLRSCVPCRKAWKELTRDEEKASSSARPRSARGGSFRWLAVAATLALAVGVAQWTISGLQARRFAEASVAEGGAFLVEEHGLRPMASGEAIAPGSEVRTGRGGGVVLRLADGSRVEMDSRSQLWVSAGRRATTVHLERGHIIVEAASQPQGRQLAVATQDCRVNVTGTIFAVGSGTKGSRVAVLEGEVRVASSGEEQVLSPGDHLSTDGRRHGSNLGEEFAWSRSAEQYQGLIAELQALDADLSALSRPDPRVASDLLARLPETTVFYAAFPNLSETWQEGLGVIGSHLEQSEVLAAWWAEKMGPVDLQGAVDELVPWLRDLGGSLGDEVAVAMWLSQDGTESGPVAMAPLLNAAAAEAFLAERVAAWNAKTPGGAEAYLLVADSADGAAGEGLWFWLAGDLLVAAPAGEPLAELSRVWTQGEGLFLGSEFAEGLLAAYDRGVDTVLGVDLESWIDSRATGEESTVLSAMGFSDARHLMVERRPGEPDGSSWELVLSFSDERRGLASWLAAPAAMGTLDFVSPDASAVAAFVVKDPALALDDLEAILAAQGESFLPKLEEETGINLRADLAEPLGGEFAFALDGPLVPQPAWKLAIEVYDPPRLQWGIERLMEEASQKATEEGLEPPVLEAEDRNGRIYYSIRHSGETKACYTYAEGYLVAAPECHLVDQALDLQASGYSLARSHHFQDLLPEDGRLDFSALLYQSLGSKLSDLADIAGDDSSPLALFSGLGESLAYVYAEDDAIFLSGESKGTQGLAVWGALLSGDLMSGLGEIAP